jgi:hypothetical protein
MSRAIILAFLLVMANLLVGCDSKPAASSADTGHRHARCKIGDRVERIHRPLCGGGVGRGAGARFRLH